MLSLHNPEFVTKNHRKGENGSPSCAKLSDFAATFAKPCSGISNEPMTTPSLPRKDTQHLV